MGVYNELLKKKNPVYWMRAICDPSPSWGHELSVGVFISLEFL
jgi:hypothetical protein